MNWLGMLCFAVLGISAFSNPVNPLSAYNIAFGLIAGFFWGWLFIFFMRVFLRIANRSLVKEKGKGEIKKAVDGALLFLVPFAVMMFIAVFVLGWSNTASFVSAGLMAVGTAASVEIGKKLEKQEIKNVIAASGVAFLFSLLWIISFSFMSKVPGYIEGGLSILLSLMEGGGAL